MLIVHILNATIYINMAVFIYKHDKSMARFLGQHEVKRRMRKSAVSFVCDMYYYIMELLTTVSFAIAAYFGPTWLYNFLFLGGQFLFVFKNTFQALSTDGTRAIFLNDLRKIKDPARLVWQLKDCCNLLFFPLLYFIFQLLYFSRRIT